jgi:hypothetical protein
MNETRKPFLVAVVAAVTLLLRGAAAPGPAPPATRGDSPRSGAAATAEKVALPAGQAETQDSEDLAARRAYVRLYQDFLDIRPRPQQATDTPTQQLRGTVAEQPVSLDISIKPDDEPVGEVLPEIAAAARDGQFRLEFMLALVADPIDSGLASDFDLAMSALQRGLADAGYKFDRKWLPWIEPEPAEADERKFRDRAGLLLFRRHQTARQRCGFGEVGKASRRPCGDPGELLGVFLIGETPKLGMHKRAFHRAVDFVLALHKAAAALSRAPAPECAGAAANDTTDCPSPRQLEIPVLGPSYSGSIDSLRIAMSKVLFDPRRVFAGGKDEVCFRVVSGSASVSDFEKRLEQGLWPRVLAARTLLPDDQLVVTALQFLREKLQWDLSRAALLIENDTLYGRTFLEQLDDDKYRSSLGQIRKLSFPSGLFALRNAWEATGASPPAAGATNRSAQSSSKTALDVSLVDQGTPVDVVGEMGPLTSRLEDMAMANLLRQISRERISYVGIAATDVKDSLFLAEQIRRWAPNVVLFVFDNNLLYVHPQYNATMFGTLTISNFPLAAEGEIRLLSAGTPDLQGRTQFASEWQEGIFLAVGSLVGRPPPPPAVWIAVSGNHSMWPIAKLEVTPEPLRGWPMFVERLGPSLRAPQECREGLPLPSWRLVLGEPLRQHTFSHLLTPLLALVAISFFVWRRDVPRDPRYPHAVQIQTRRLQEAGTALLCLVGSMILVLGAMDGFGWPHLSLLFISYLWLAWVFFQTARPDPAAGIGRRGLEHSARHILAIAGPLLPFLLVVCLLVLWFPRWDLDDANLFAERARSISGGLSPLVSLSWLGGSIFLWVLVELRRQLMAERHRAVWPLDDRLAASLAGTSAKAGEIADLLRCTVPPGWHLWLIAAIIIVPLLHLWQKMQPIAESRAYGKAALLGSALVAFLSLLSVCRFLRVWWTLKRLLRRIVEAGLLASFKEVAPAVGWKPLQLAWYQPTFNVVAQSALQLQQLAAQQLVPRRFDPDSLRELLAQVFSGESKHRFDLEMQARRELSRRFEEACKDLAHQPPVAQITDFYAVRLIAYLRDVFGQLRYTVLAATFTGIPLMMAAATYAFQPKRLAALILWSTLTASSTAILVSFIEMDRDAVLSAIGNTDPGKVTRDWSFISKIVVYGILPVLGLVASQFPTMGRLLSGMLDPLSRVLGAG